ESYDLTRFRTARDRDYQCSRRFLIKRSLAKYSLEAFRRSKVEPELSVGEMLDRDAALVSEARTCDLERAIHEVARDQREQEFAFFCILEGPCRFIRITRIIGRNKR